MLTVKCIKGTEKRELFATSVVKKKERKKETGMHREGKCVCVHVTQQKKGRWEKRRERDQREKTMGKEREMIDCKSH